MKVNWNTLILTAGFGIICYFGRQSYEDVKSTHDAIITMREQMKFLVPRGEYDVQLSEIKARLGAIEMEIQKFKRHEY